ncbi:hypothetical protein [Kiloniella sp. b19]|uniref:hypothetical protein n=1 Tax=Kiloniella sp. GXU_MW_B19 TaxID=3141326 RepID=UPI0031CE8994
MTVYALFCDGHQISDPATSTETLLKEANANGLTIRQPDGAVQFRPGFMISATRVRNSNRLKAIQERSNSHASI